LSTGISLVFFVYSLYILSSNRHGHTPCSSSTPCQLRASNGYVWDMYSDVPGGTPAYYFTFGDDQCGNYSGEGDCYNREHSFPKSWYGDVLPMNTDLFHLYPTDGWVNQKDQIIHMVR